jgi:hypothetical protein
MKRAVCIATLLFAACAQTTILSSWKDPTAGALRFHKTIVFAPARDASLRRSAENELAKQLAERGVQSVPSYTVFPDPVRPEDESVRERVKELGFDGAIVMRVVSVNREATWMPGTWSGPYYSFWGWPAYDPGYVTYDTYVRVETNVYSLPDERLVWASATRTANPKDVRDLVDETVKAVTKSMRDQGMV